MADSQDTTTLPISRRHALAAALGTALTATTAAAAEDGDRNFWTVAESRYKAADAAYTEADEAYEDERYKSQADYPKLPDLMLFSAVLGSQGSQAIGLQWFRSYLAFNSELRAALRHPAMMMTGEVLTRFYDEQMAGGRAFAPYSLPDRATFVAEGMAHRANSLAILNVWLADCRRIDEAHGLPTLLANRESAEKAYSSARDVLINAPANGYAGIAVKLRRLLESHSSFDDDIDSELMRRLAADVERLAEVQS